MSHQTFADAFAPAETRYARQVMAATWGHLAPAKNVTYRGSLTFAIGCFGSDDVNPTVLTCSFPELEDSPWLYDAIQELIDQQTEYNTPDGDKQRWDVGSVYRWEGSFRNYRWRGRFRKMEVV